MAEAEEVGYESDLTDEQYDLLKGLFERNGKVGRPTTIDVRGVLNAIFYLLRTGCQWRMVPKTYPKWQTVRYYFDKWNESGLWIEINRQLVAQVRQKKAQRHAQFSDLG